MKKSNSAVALADTIIKVDEFIGYGEDIILERSAIRPSKTNRKHFSPTKLQQLADNMRMVGILQRILIRPVEPTEAEPQAYEIVYGERRWIAAGMAEIDLIPCNVKILTDEQASKIQIFENLYKEDVHPLEEAMGYQNLMMAHNYTVDMIVAELGLGKSYIYSRLKLCDLTTSLRDQFIDDKFSASVALVIARIPVPELQIKAAWQITNAESDEPLSARQAAKLIQDNFMLKLEHAKFPINDGKLLADVGTCKQCPKRTGNQPEIYEGINPQICTDPDCFAEKTAAVHYQEIRKYHLKGIEVLEDKEGELALADAEVAKDLSVCGLTKLKHFVRIAKNVDRSLTFDDLLQPDQRPKYSTVVVDKDKKFHPIYDLFKAQDALTVAGYCLQIGDHIATTTLSDSTTNSTNTNLDASDETDNTTTEVTAPHTPPVVDHDAAIAARVQRDDERMAKASEETDYRVRLYKQLRAKGANGFKLETLREFVKFVLKDDNGYTLPDDLMTGLYPFSSFSDQVVCDYIDTAPLESVQLILVDMVLSDALYMSSATLNDIGSDTDRFNTVLAMARAEGIDPDEVRTPTKPAKRTPKQKATDATATTDAPAKTPGKRGPKPKVKTGVTVVPASESGSVSSAWPFPRASQPN